MKLKGITVTLIDKQQTGTDPFGKPIYSDVEIQVDDVLVAPTKSEEVLTRQNLTGRTAVYTLAIPKMIIMIGKTKKFAFLENVGECLEYL